MTDIQEFDTSGGPTSVAHRFLGTLATRDFAGLARCLHPDVRMQAVLPIGHAERHGADVVAESFRDWFGDAHAVELVGSTVDEVGPRLKLWWRLRVRFSPDEPGWHLVEQHAFADARDRIDAIDLVCSGFNPVEAT
ncbi:MAG: nuclear transport factor 2 family protein [Acidimicrobiales bacterium]|nr:nuclear transport factor 2 family protein [Acidimicrobiales bacterium]